jgi:hypothetical protein
LVDLNLLEVIYVPAFVGVVMIGRGFEHGDEFHIFDHVNGVPQYFGDPFSLGHED